LGASGLREERGAAARRETAKMAAGARSWDFSFLLYSELSEEAMQAMLEQDYPGDVSYLQRICIAGEIRNRRTLRELEKIAIESALGKI
jgi:hypothetical protein